MAIATAGLLGLAFTSGEAVARGGGSFHGSGMSLGRGFQNHGDMHFFYGHGFNTTAHRGLRSEGGDRHGAHSRHERFANSAERGAFGRTAHIAEGHWHASVGFGDHRHGSSHVEGIWSR